MNASLSKQELRGQIRAKPSPGRETKNAAITKKVLEHVKEKNGTVLIYLSLGNEVDTTAMIKELTKTRTLCVPYYDPKQDFYSVSVLDSIKDTVAGKHGIREPRTKQSVNLSTIAVCIIPGVAFDKQGARLGRGAGVFDRLLSQTKAYKIGVAYEEQIVEEVPRSSHDITMNAVITENHVYAN